MERLAQSAIGSAGYGVLRYGHVPPSLLHMRHRRRSDDSIRFRRLMILALLALTVAGGMRRWATPVTASLSALPAPSGPTSAVPAVPPLPGADAAIATAPMVPAAVATAPAPAPHLSSWSLAPAEVLLPTRVRSRAAAADRAPPPPAATPVAPLDVAGLRATLNGITAASAGQYGITVIDLTSGQELDINAAQPMVAASVNKLEILAALYHEVEQGRLNLDQSLSATAGDMQNYGTGVIRYQPVGTTYTLRELARLLIEDSDNTASYMLAQTIGLPTIEQLVQGWGLPATQVGKETSSPRDAARFLALLYQGKLANPVDTGQMIDYLTHTAFNDRLPAGVPPGLTVAHKIGTQVKVENDVAIVYLTGRPYVLSVFAGQVDEDAAVATERAISRSVYQFELHAKGDV